MSITRISWFELPFIEYFEQKLMRDISNFESSKSHALKFQIKGMHILNIFYKIVAWLLFQFVILINQILETHLQNAALSQLHPMSNGAEDPSID